LLRSIGIALHEGSAPGWQPASVGVELDPSAELTLADKLLMREEGMAHPVVHSETPHVAVASGCILGKGALWDQRTGTFLFVDVMDPSVWWYRPETGRHGRIAVPERTGFVALTADPDIVLAGFKSGLVRLHLFGGEIQPIVSPEPELPGNSIGDGHVGPDGTLYFGTMDDAGKQPTGAFWRWDGHRLARFDEGFIVTNGPAVSHDGRTLYAADTRGRMVFVYDLSDGIPGNRRRFAHFEDGWGDPDGMAVDAEGHLWVCHWGASRITRFTPDGTAERVVPIPTAQVTNCAFGGADLTTLFITTACIGHDLEIDPKAGHVFSVGAGVRGSPSNIVSG
jgi:sugar lactone lactonase YvrE